MAFQENLNASDGTAERGRDSFRMFRTNLILIVKLPHSIAEFKFDFKSRNRITVESFRFDCPIFALIAEFIANLRMSNHLTIKVCY